MMLRKIGEPSFVDALRSDIYAALEEFGGQVVNEVQEKLSVPVEYTSGPRGGRRAIRSKPGEPPRRETGELQDSIASAVEVDAAELSVTISSDCPYAGHLEGMERIILNDNEENYAEPFFDAMQRALGGR